MKNIKTKLEALELPIIKEVRNKDYVPYGDDNMFPAKIIELYNKSSIHRTAIDSIIMNAYELGLVGGDTVVNKKDQTLNEIYELIINDMVLFNGFSLNVIWNKQGNKIVEVYHLPFNNVRSGKYNEEEEIDSYFYSNDWLSIRKNPPSDYKSFSETENKGEDGSQIFYSYVYASGNEYYPLPQYIAAVNDIELDARISRYHNANISNGLAPSMFIKLRNGIPTPEERDVIYNEITSTFTGEHNAGRYFLAFSDADNAMEVQTIANVNDDYYVVLDERITSRILTAHKITSPLLLGIKDSSGFSSNADELMVAQNHFKEIVIDPLRKKILNKFLKIYTLMGLGEKIEISIKKLDDDV